MEKELKSKANKYGNSRPKINYPLDLRNLSSEELCNIKSPKLKLNPFEGMNIKDGSFLDNIDGRSQCKLCKKSRKYFCYTCYIPVSGLEDKIPKVQVIFLIEYPFNILNVAIHPSYPAREYVNHHWYGIDMPKTCLPLAGDWIMNSASSQSLNIILFSSLSSLSIKPLLFFQQQEFTPVGICHGPTRYLPVEGTG